MGSGGVIEYAIWHHPLRAGPEAFGMAEWMIDAYTPYVKPGMICVDVGAHIGDTTVPLGIIAGKDGMVWAFEPNPFVYPTLKTNAFLNSNRVNIVPINCAVMGVFGKTTFRYTDEGAYNGGDTEPFEDRLQYFGSCEPVEVDCVDLSRMVTRFDFLKIDAEGSDFFILEDMRELVIENRATVQCELYPSITEPERRAFFNLIDGMGYTAKLLPDYQPMDEAAFVTTTQCSNFIAIPV